jgi:hypothetical protein
MLRSLLVFRGPNRGSRVENAAGRDEASLWGVFVRKHSTVAPFILIINSMLVFLKGQMQGLRLQKRENLNVPKKRFSA